MNGRRIPWETLVALILGIVLGLVYAWVLAPVQVVDSAPAALRADFKDQYRAAIAAAYAANGDLPRAQSRLSLLGDADPYQSLSAQAQQMLAEGRSREAEEVAQLASALHGLEPTLPPATPTPGSARTPTRSANSSPIPTATSGEIETPLPFYSPTARPSDTPIPTPGRPFELASQDNVCDETLPEGLLQVVVQTAARKQLPGVELVISWAGGEEHFFTGFKPELGNGYADYQMTPGVTYILRAAEGGGVVSGLTPPACQGSNGEPFSGGIRIVLQQP